MRWLVDGMNVIGSRPDGWWRDRPGAQRRLIERLGAFLEATDDEATVVFDGRPIEFSSSLACLHVRFTPVRRDGADDVITDQVAHDRDPATLRVVTSDARLAARVRAHGASVVPAGAFRRLLDAVEAPDRPRTADSA